MKYSDLISIFLSVIGILLTIYSIKNSDANKNLNDKNSYNNSVGVIKTIYRQIRSFIENKRLLSGTLITITISMLWAISNVSYRLLMIKDNNFLFISAYTLLSASFFCFLFSFILKDRKNINTEKIELNTLDFIFIIIPNVINFCSFILALKYITATQVIILNKLNPLFLLLILALFMKEKFTQVGVASLISSLCGVYVLLDINNIGFISLFESTKAIGAVLAIIAGISFSVLTVGFYKSQKHNINSSYHIKLKYMGYVFVYSFVLFSPVLPFIVIPKIDNLMLIVIILNGLRLAVVYILYREAISLTNPLFVSVVVSLEIIFTMFLEKYWLNSAITGSSVIGSILILGAIWSLIIDNQNKNSKFAEIIN
jgi:drug/metabolite transporter (DMT)-like permease